jgi:hypothetical protein
MKDIEMRSKIIKVLSDTMEVLTEDEIADKIGINNSTGYISLSHNLNRLCIARSIKKYRQDFNPDRYYINNYSV